MTTTRTFKIGDKVKIDFNDYHTKGVIKAGPISIGYNDNYVVETEDYVFIANRNDKHVYSCISNIQLWMAEHIKPAVKDYTELATFEYTKIGSRRVARYTLGVVEDNSEYIEGIDLNDGEQYKRFLKSRIKGKIFRALRD